jgi:hypothetical protein
VEDIEASRDPATSSLNGNVDSVAIDRAMARLHVASCFTQIVDAPTRVRVRFVLDAGSLKARSVLTDYALSLPETVRVCVREKIEAQDFPQVRQFKHAIVVRSMDTKH